jgi:hypothetical protein
MTAHREHRPTMTPQRSASMASATERTAKATIAFDHDRTGQRRTTPERRDEYRRDDPPRSTT